MQHRRHLVLVPVLVVLVHVLFLRGYGWFRDEFYYFACARHLAFGYVDHPALSIVPLWIVRSILGDSLVAARLLVALASGTTVAVVGLMTRDMGGGRFAQTLAMVCATVAPVYLALASFYSMNVFDVMIWAIAAWLVVTLVNAPRLSTWIALGIVLGLGVENKISVLWLIGGLTIGLLVTDYRIVRSPGPWVAMLIAGALAAPYAMWQVANGWPTLEFIRRASSDKMIAQAPWSFLLSQVTDMHPLTLPVWLGGLWFFLMDPRGRPYRSLGVMFLCVLGLLLVNATSRPEYLAPAYTALFAGGACWLEAATARFGKPIQTAAIGALTVAGLITAPLAMPMLPVDTYIQYAAVLGEKPSTDEKKELADLPQFYADRFGWDELVAATTQAFESLTDEERRVAAIFTSNYGEAGAVDVLGRAARLPFALSGHNNYWLWGPNGFTGEVLIALTQSRERLEARFEDVQQVGTIECQHCMPYQNHRPVFVCRRPKQPIAEIWPQVKHFD
jgi:hypothetical protein